jgi:deferrochelatase/peroxidase EfeB
MSEPGQEPAAGQEDPDLAGPSPAAGPRRRSFLRGAVGAGVAGAAAAGFAVGTALPEGRAAAAPGLADRLPAVPFHGEHQAAILRQPEPRTAVISFSVTADSPAELADLMRTITGRARFLTSGGVPPEAGITAPPSDSGVLGPDVIADGLTVTVGVGARPGSRR